MNTILFTKIVRTTIAVVFILGTILGPVPYRVSAQETLPWRDEFDGALADGWYWINGNPAKWNLTENPGALSIYTSPYATGGENLLLHPVAQEDFTIETRLFFNPDTNFQFAGLVLWQDKDNFLQLGRAFCYYEESPCVGNGIYFDKILGGGIVDGNFATVLDAPSGTYLRLVHRGNYTFAYYSADGLAWTFMGGHATPEGFTVNAIGLTSSQDFNTPDGDIPADFDYFELAEGPLPAVTLAFWEQEAGDVDAFIDQRISNFEGANPDIAIVRTHYENEDLKNQFLAASQAGTAPEVVRVPNDFAGPFTQADTLAPVSILFDAAFLDQFLPGSLEPAVVRGTLWGVPDNYGNHLMLMYNKSLIADPPETAEPPATFEELIIMANDLTTGEIQGFAYNEKEPFWGAGFYGAFGGWPLDAEDQPQFNNPAFIDYLDYVARLKADGVIPQECDYGCADSLFREGHAAMIINGDWALGDYVNALGDFLGVVPVPPINGNPYTEMTSGKYFMTSTGAAEDQDTKEAVQKFITYMTSADVQKIWLDEMKRLPSNTVVAEDPTITGDPILAGSMVALANGRGMPAAPEMRCAWDAWRFALEGVMNGWTSSADAAAAAQVTADNCVFALSNPPNPDEAFISADSGGNTVYAYMWPIYTPIDLQIFDQSGEKLYQHSGSILAGPWWWVPQIPNGSVAIFNLENGFDLLPGHVIKLDGAGISKTYTVTNFAITSLDIPTNTVSGIGTPGSLVTICADNAPGTDCRYATVDNETNWSAPPDGSTPFILQYGINGWSAERKENSRDETYASWSLSPVEIRWFVGLGTGSSPEQQPAQQKVVDDFNASHLGIHLTLDVYPNDQARDILAQQIADGNPPDIVGPVGWGGSNSFHDKWLDLNPLISSTYYDTSIFNPQLYSMYQTDLGQEGLPFAVYPSAIYYNPALFDDAELNDPPVQYGDPYVMPNGDSVEWNWDTVAKVSKLLTLDSNGRNAKDPDFDPSNIVQYGFSFGWQNHPNYTGSFWQSSTMVQGSGPYTASVPQAWKDAWHWIYDGIWGMQPYYPGGDSGYNRFNDGTVAMVESPSWFMCCNTNLTDSGGTFQFAAMPTYSSDVAGRIDADTFRIMKGSQHPEEAFEVLTYLVGPEGVDTLLIGSEEIAPAYSAVSALTEKQDAFVAAQSAQFPFVTQDSWDVLLQGLNYPDIPSAEGWTPNYDDAWNRGNEFRDMMYWESSINIDYEIACYESNLESIFNGQPMIECRHPRFDVRANTDQIEAWEWMVGDVLTLTINDVEENSITQTVGFAPWDPNQSYVLFNLRDLDEPYDIQTGDEVTLSNGVITKETTVTNLAFTDIDSGLDTVNGVAEPGTRVDLWACVYNGCFNRHVTADSDGNWFADFANPGSEGDEQDIVDIVAGTGVDSRQADDENDSTMYGIAWPRFDVRADVDRVEPFDWKVGDTLTLSVGGKEFTGTYDYGFSFDLSGVYDIKLGDPIRLSNGTITKKTTVTEIEITKIDLALDTVNGIAVPGARVDLYACVYNGCFNRIVVADGDGNWFADFANPGLKGNEQDIVDIVPGTWVDAWIEDKDSDATAYGVTVPNPFVEAAPYSDWIHARGWPRGTSIAMKIDDLSTEEEVDYTEVGTMGQAPWNPGDPNDIVADFRWPDQFIPGPGYIITMTGDVYGNPVTKTLTVSTLFVSTADPSTDTVVGIADLGTPVHVCANIPNNCVTRWVTPAGTSGAWTAKYGVGGIPPDDVATVNLLPGSNGWASQDDGDGDLTWYDWHVPNPRITASITDDWFRVEDFPPNTTLDIKIYKSQGGDLYKNDTRTTDGNGFAFWASWETGTNVDLKPGMFLVTQSGDVTKDIVLEPLLLFTLDTDADFLAGNAPPNRDMWVGTGDDNSWCSMNVTSGPDGSWNAEFASQDPPCDVEPGMWAAAQIFDADGDATEANPGFPRGSHDYDKGVMSSLSCRAGGWTVDPDNQERPVQVRILSDGVVVSELTANVDGNRGFEVDLWGVISSYEGHEIKVEAYDEESDAWYTLENSPRDLTCRTYDIYTYDPLTGTIKQISNLRETDEYNPSWSPNGRVIAHDVVTPNSHDIYLTQVATGKSAPLKGADGGNDAAWSPNGLWIAFDRRWAGDESLYVVPFAGGQRRLVREHAVSAGWSPNGLRIAFQDLADGGKLKTVGLLGQIVITVADFGDNPTWSPDGKWIAYQRYGDIWKVRVGPLGTPLGAPILVVDMATDVGSPTWSVDGTTIVFGYGPGGDWDLWSVSAAGGEPVWLTGAPAVGDYDPEYARSGSSIAYESVSPDGQAERYWVTAYTYDPPVGTFGMGSHPYHFEATWEGGGETTEDVYLNVTYDAASHDGYALLRPNAVLAGPDCSSIGAIRPDQPTRFLSGYLTDREMTYAETGAFFNNLSANAVWDFNTSAELVPNEIIPFSWDNTNAWLQYVCGYTQP